MYSNVREPEIVRTENAVDPADKRHINANDINVAITVIYTSDGAAFTYDKEGTIPVKAEEMFNLFVKGVIACKDDVYYACTSCTEAGVITFAFPVES